MASEAKEMKYRRRGRVPGPPEHGQRSDRSGALDWAALKHDPAELLRKLDEVRDQITRSCELVADCHRAVSRRSAAQSRCAPRTPSRLQRTSHAWASTTTARATLAGTGLACRRAHMIGRRASYLTTRTPGSRSDSSTTMRGSRRAT